MKSGTVQSLRPNLNVYLPKLYSEAEVRIPSWPPAPGWPPPRCRIQRLTCDASTDYCDFKSLLRNSALSNCSFLRTEIVANQRLSFRAS